MLTHQREREGRAIVDNDLTVAVEYLSARCDQSNGSDLVLFGKFPIVAALENLEVPQSRQQGKEHQNHRDPNHDDSGLNEPLIFVKVF